MNQSTVSELMTATKPSQPRRRRFRLSGLEMFGFIDTPGSTSTPGEVMLLVAEAPQVAPAPILAPAPQLSDDPFADWTPDDMSQRLPKGRVRWGLLTSMLIVFTGVAVAALWVYQLPQEQIRQARATMESSIAAVSSDLTTFRELNTALDAQTLDTSLVNRTLLSLEDSNRQVFAAAGALPQTDSAARARVIEASGTLSEAQRTFTEAYTYRLTVVPVLAAPGLETDPTLTTLEDAAAAFSEWQARFEEVRVALPEGTFSDVTLRMHGLGAAISQIQRLYLDGLRTGDQAAAAAAMATLNRSLNEVGSILFEQLAASKARVALLIDEAMKDIEAVPSMLG